MRLLLLTLLLTGCAGPVTYSQYTEPQDKAWDRRDQLSCGDLAKQMTLTGEIEEYVDGSYERCDQELMERRDEVAGDL